VIICINLFLIGLLPLYGLFGFIPNIGFGLVYPEELYIYAPIFGFNYGSVQAFTRSVYAELIPPGRESQLFSLYGI